MSDPSRSLPLVVMALPAEAQGLFAQAGIDVLYTGVGKVNATYRLARCLTERRARGAMPSVVVNFGTAGSAKHPTGTLLACTRFTQRDMDVRGLGFSLGETPFEDLPPLLEFPCLFESLPQASCASADRFETQRVEALHDAVDMEAYALAKVCALEGVAFASVKYISDGADEHAHRDWHASLAPASRAFFDLYLTLMRSVQEPT